MGGEASGDTATGAAPADPPLDRWLPDFQVRTHHRRTARADAADVWAQAAAVRLSDTRTLGRLVRWRIPGSPAEMTFRELLARHPFAVLDEGPGYSISGLCGRIWTLRNDYGRVADPEAFRAWAEPGTVRVLIANWVRETEGGVELCDEARVAPVDAAAAVRLRVLWAAIGRFEPLIGSEPVGLAVRRATAPS